MRAASIALLLFAAAAAEAQLVETIEVRVTNVDVVVTDRSGKPVVGLTKDDFQIFENGFEQTITHFYELRDGSESQRPQLDVPEELQRRRVVIFVDQDSIDIRRRTDSFAALERSLDRLLRDGDEAMLVSLYRDRRVVTPMTGDREVIRTAIREAANAPVGVARRQLARERVIREATDLLGTVQEASMSAAGGGLQKELLTMAQAYDRSRTTAKSHADELFSGQKMLVQALHGTLESLAGLDGRKALIFIGGDLQRRPGSDLFEAVDGVYRTSNVPIIGNSTTSSQVDLTNELADLALQANESGVTLYLMNAADHSSRRSAAVSAHLDSTDTMNDSGLDLETALSMTTLAAETGGQALVNSINYDLAMEGVVRDLGSYYSLGYRPPGGAGERTIKVKVKKPDLIARARHGYTLQTTDEQVTDRVVANAFHPRMSSDLPVTVDIGKPTKDGDAYLMNVTVRFPGDLTTIPDGESQVGELGLYFVTANAEGRRSLVAKDIQSFKYSADQAREARSKPFTYTAAVRVRAGEQLLSVAVIDRLAGRSGFARTKFRAP